MDKALEQVVNTTEPLASLEYDVRKAFEYLSAGKREGLVYLLAAIATLRSVQAQGGRVEYDG